MDDHKVLLQNFDWILDYSDEFWMNFGYSRMPPKSSFYNIRVQEGWGVIGVSNLEDKE